MDLLIPQACKRGRATFVMCHVVSYNWLIHIACADCVFTPAEPHICQVDAPDWWLEIFKRGLFLT